MERKTIIFALVAVLTLNMSLGLFYSTRAFAETTLTANCFFPRHNPMMTGLLAPWMEAVEKASNGRIKIKVPAASLAPPPRQWDMVEKGIADVALTPNSFQRKRLILPRVAELPFFTFSSEASSIAMWRTQKKFFDPVNEYKGMKLLAQFVFPGNVFVSATKPILSVADLKGYKVRTAPGPQKAAMDALGATAVPSPGPKMFELISKGTVDGVVAGHGTILSFKLGRYTKYVTEVPGKINTTSFSFIMNEKVWNSLSKEDQKAIESASYEKIVQAEGKAWDAYDRKAQEEYPKYGIKTYTASDAFIAEMKQKLAFIEKKWIKDANKRGIDAEAALKYFRAEAEKLSK